MSRTLAAMLLPLLAAATQAQVSTAWSNAPGGVALALDGADHVYTARWDYNPAGDIYLAKRNSDGVLLWEVRHDNTDNTRHEVANWLATDSAGNVIVVGTIRSGYSNPVNANSLLMKFSPSGQLLWRQVYDNPFDGSSAVRVLVDESNAVYALGLGHGPAGLVTTIRKYSAGGQFQWAWYDSAGIGAPVQFKWAPDGAMLVSARALIGSINGHAKVDRNGQTVWALAGVNSLTLGDAAGDAAGHTYVVHGEYAPGATGSVLRKLSPGGSELWRRTQPMSAFRVEVPRDGGALISGFPNASFMRFDADGGELWRSLGNNGLGCTLLHSQMLLDAQDNAYLAAGALTNMAVCRMNADGTPGWTGTASGSSYAAAIGLGGDGAVYAVGGTTVKFVQGPPPPPTQADLSLTLVDAPDPVRTGANLVYTATVRNLGPAESTSVRLVDTLPDNVRFVGATSSQGSCSGAPALSCELGTLAVGAQATVTVTVRPSRRGTLANTARVSAAQPDPVAGNNGATATTTVTRR